MPNIQANKTPSGRVRRRFLARRLEILRAAGETFRARGFAETGMRDIAEAAALSPGNLYNYFRGKNEIVYFCQDNSLDRMIAALEDARRLKASAAEKLRAIVVSHLRCVLDEVGGTAAHLLPDALPPRLQRGLLAKRDRYEEGVRNVITAGVRSGEFVPCDPPLVARAVLGALNWSVRWFSPSGTMTAADIGEGFADYLIRGLLAKPSALRSVSAPSRRHRQAHDHVSAGTQKRASTR